MSNISLPEDFNINKSNFKNNYIKYYDKMDYGITITNNYNSNRQKDDVVLQKLDTLFIKSG